MRRIPLTLLASLFFACAGPAAKPAVRAPAAKPAPPTVRLEADAPAVIFDLPKGWSATPQDDNPALLVMTRGRFEAASVMLEAAAPGDQVEAVALKWVQLSVMALNFFTVTDFDPPTYPSDEEAEFVIRGVDGEQRPMSLLFRVKLVPSRTHDYWAVVMVTGPSGDLYELEAAAAGIVKSLRVEPESPQK